MSEAVAIAAAFELPPGRYPEADTVDLFRRVLRGLDGQRSGVRPQEIDGLLTCPSGGVAGFDPYVHEKLISELGIRPALAETVNLGGADLRLDGRSRRDRDPGRAGERGHLHRRGQVHEAQRGRGGADGQSHQRQLAGDALRHLHSRALCPHRQPVHGRARGYRQQTSRGLRWPSANGPCSIRRRACTRRGRSRSATCWPRA